LEYRIDDEDCLGRRILRLTHDNNKSTKSMMNADGSANQTNNNHSFAHHPDVNCASGEDFGCGLPLSSWIIDKETGTGTGAEYRGSFFSIENVDGTTSEVEVDEKLSFLSYLLTESNTNTNTNTGNTGNTGTLSSCASFRTATTGITSSANEGTATPTASNYTPESAHTTSSNATITSTSASSLLTARLSQS
jgi:hypothetical protein